MILQLLIQITWKAIFQKMGRFNQITLFLWFKIMVGKSYHKIRTLTSSKHRNGFYQNHVLYLFWLNSYCNIFWLLYITHYSSVWPPLALITCFNRFWKNIYSAADIRFSIVFPFFRDCSFKTIKVYYYYYYYY